MPDANRKVKSTIHWVSAPHAKEVEVRLFDRLFLNEDPDDAEEGKDFRSNLNPESLEMRKGYISSGIENAGANWTNFSSNGLAIFVLIMIHTRENPVFNRTVTLRDAWTKIEKIPACPSPGGH
jgi:glutaminyl-tRNA synthetase